MTLTDIFQKIFVISKHDKKQIIKNELKYLDFEFLDAVIPEHLKMPQRAKVGNRLSHLEAIKKAKALNYKNILVFEEDIVFDKDIEYKSFLCNIKEFIDNEDWCCFYLGGSHRGKSKIIKTDNPNIVKTLGTIATHAIAYNQTYYDKLIDLFSAKDDHPYPIDYFLCGSSQDKNYFCKENPCFSIYPRFVLQKPGSNIQGIFYPSEHWKENLVF
jgi:hypothetical protein